MKFTLHTKLFISFTFVLLLLAFSLILGYIFFDRNTLLLILIGSFVVLLLISFLLSLKITQPIKKLQQAVLSLQQGQLNTNIDIRSGDDIETLSNTLGNTLRQLVQREQSLTHDKKETDTLLASLTDGVIILDQQGNIIALSKAAENTCGVQAESIVGKNIDSILRFYEGGKIVPFSIYSNQSELAEKESKTKGMHLNKNDGSKTYLVLTIIPAQGQNAGFIVALHDLSSKHELEEIKLDFVSMAAHELRTPLTAIHGYASILKLQNSKQLDSAGKEILNRLIISTENLGNLIESFLSVSRIERSIFSIDVRPIDLTSTIKNAVDSMRHQAYTKNQTITLSILDQLPVVFADAFRIGQVVLNLIANAVNYTGRDGKIDIKAEKKDNILQVSVSDTGPGIPKDALQKLFSKFFRVSGPLQQGSKGTGLGLYICKSIIELHKGKIWVESEVGRGSTFYFVLPLASPSEIEAYQSKKPALKIA